MDIASIRTFLASAETGSFAAAARRVNASPSTVTERIKTLEHQLSARLFNRDKRGCVLTPAGRRFLTPAQNMMRAWEDGQREVTLPSRFAHSITIGGQYGLWPHLLFDLLSDLKRDRRDVAVRALVGTPQRFNQELADGTIDMAFLYDPVFRKDLLTDELFQDELVLVTTMPDMPWMDNYVRVEWGAAVDAEISSRLGIVAGAGLTIELGLLSASWLIRESACGYMPKRMVAAELGGGQLHEIAGAPRVSYSAYGCWRREMDQEIAGDLIARARQLAEPLFEVGQS